MEIGVHAIRKLHKQVVMEDLKEDLKEYGHVLVFGLRGARALQCDRGMLGQVCARASVCA